MTTNSVNLEELANTIAEKDVYSLNCRTAMMLGKYEIDWGKNKKNHIPNGCKDRSRFSQEKYKFFLNAPFEISNKCCGVMKKSPMHTYNRKTGRKPITAQMASESRLRAQKWIQNGCNGFDMKNPISNPMSFWTEQDVLLYIYMQKLSIASVYGDVVIDYAKMGQIENQMNLADFGVFDLEIPLLRTTGRDRTGCMFCGYGCHLEKSPGRFERMKETHPNIYDYIMKDWENGGLGYKKIIDWINENGNLDIKY